MWIPEHTIVVCLRRTCAEDAYPRFSVPPPRRAWGPSHPLTRAPAHKVLGVGWKVARIVCLCMAVQYARVCRWIGRRGRFHPREHCFVNHPDPTKTASDQGLCAMRSGTRRHAAPCISPYPHMHTCTSDTSYTQALVDAITGPYGTPIPPSIRVTLITSSGPHRAGSRPLHRTRPS
jgi:hypothetical protein